MKNISLPFKIGILLFLAILIVLIIGFVSYRSMQSIVASIHSEAKPDRTLIALKNISLELEKAENSIRIYSLSKSTRALDNYYFALQDIDNEIERLRSIRENEELLASLDTLQILIAEKQFIWKEILRINQDDVIANKLRSLSDTLLKRDTASRAVRITDTLIRREIVQQPDPGEEQLEDSRTFFQKLFGKKQEEPLADTDPESDDQELVLRKESATEDTSIVDTLLVAAASEINTREIAEMITEVGDEDELLNYRIKREELRLAGINRKLTEKFYALMETMEQTQRASLLVKAKNADTLARKTYLWMGLFSAAVTILAIVVLFTVAGYMRKSIAYQKALEYSKREAEKLARTKEIFTANVSHEIRTPLHAIYGFLKQINTKKMDPGNQEKIQVAISSSENLLRIVNDVLDFSKLEAGKIRLEKEPFDLREIFSHTYQLFSEEAVKNNSRLKLEVDKDVSEVLLGDPYRLKQILFNLVSNAIKFTHKGVVEVHAREKQIYKRRVELIITVADTGIGIAPEKTSVIFDDYTQAEAGTTQRFGGTGLGLSIVKKIIDLFGGTIELESKLNAGSKFTCRLPMDKGKAGQLAQRTAVQKTEVPPALRGHKALIADDEEYNRRLLKALLDKWGMTYDEASDGLEAIEMLKSNTYSVLLLDIRMPALDGVKIARFVRESMGKPVEELPLVAVTAATSEKDRTRYLGEGFNEVISKPFDELELSTMLESLIAGGKPAVKVSSSIRKSKRNGVDFVNLEKMANNDTVFIREMLELFLHSFRSGLDEIESGMASRDYGQIAETAHKISSPCRHLGAKNLLACTKELEAKSGNAASETDVQEMIDQLKTEFKGVEKQIIDKLAEL